MIPRGKAYALHTPSEIISIKSASLNIIRLWVFNIPAPDSELYRTPAYLRFSRVGGR